MTYPFIFHRSTLLVLHTDVSGLISCTLNYEMDGGGRYLLLRNVLRL